MLGLLLDLHLREISAHDEGAFNIEVEEVEIVAAVEAIVEGVVVVVEEEGVAGGDTCTCFTEV